MTSKLKTDVLETGSGSGTIALNNQLSGMTSASVPAGSVLQVIHVKGSGSDISTTSTSYVASGLQASITPQSASSKIMIILDSISYTNGAINSRGIGVSIYRGGSEPSPSMRGGVNRTNSGAWISIPYSVSALDSPNTTNAVVYEPYFKCWGASGHFFVDHVESNPTITLIEIKG